MIIESGIIIFVGLLLLFIKLPLRWSLTLLNHALVLDIVVSILAYMLHWGTFTGVMAAAVAGLMCSGFTAVGKWLLGYIANNKYYPGVIDMTHKLREQANAQGVQQTAR